MLGSWMWSRVLDLMGTEFDPREESLATLRTLVMDVDSVRYCFHISPSCVRCSLLTALFHLNLRPQAQVSKGCHRRNHDAGIACLQRTGRKPRRLASLAAHLMNDPILIDKLSNRQFIEKYARPGCVGLVG